MRMRSRRPPASRVEKTPLRTPAGSALVTENSGHARMLPYAASLLGPEEEWRMESSMVGVGVEVLIFSLLTLIPLWRIFSRAGLAPAHALWVVVPFVGWVIAGLVLALSDWPALRAQERTEDLAGARIGPSGR